MPKVRRNIKQNEELFMKKIFSLSFLDGLLRFSALFLITDLSMSVYTESIISIIAAVLFIAIYYVISHFIAKKITVKNRPAFYISSLSVFLLLLFILGITVKLGAAEIHIFPQGAWDTGTGWAAIMLCAVLVIASAVERSVMIFISVYRRRKNDS